MFPSSRYRGLSSPFTCSKLSLSSSTGVSLYCFWGNSFTIFYTFWKLFWAPKIFSHSAFYTFLWCFPVPGTEVLVAPLPARSFPYPLAQGLAFSAGEYNPDRENNARQVHEAASEDSIWRLLGTPDRLSEERLIPLVEIAIGWGHLEDAKTSCHWHNVGRHQIQPPKWKKNK